MNTRLSIKLENNSQKRIKRGREREGKKEKENNEKECFLLLLRVFEFVSFDCELM